MKKILVFAAVCFVLSACIPAAFQPQPAASPAPVIPDIQATVAAQVEQTLQSLPTPTLAPSTTPIVITATSAPTNTMPPPTFTATQVPATLTSTLSGTATSTVETPPATASMVPAVNTTPTGTSHYQYYGTMPPDLPSGKIAMINKSKRDAYISLQCTTTDGYVTIIEYPVGGSRVGTRAPAGNYVYVAWVGGKQFTGSFKLEKSGEASIWMYKDRVEVK